MKFAERLDGVDPERIALWGDSYTGGQVIVVGAIEQRVKVIVAQIPVFGAEPPEVEPSRANFDLIKEILSRGDVRGSPETTVGPMPVVSSDPAGTPSLLKPIQAFRWFIDYGGRAGRQGFSERVDGGAGGDGRPGTGRVGALLRRPALPARNHPHPMEVGPSTASNTMFTYR